MHIFCSWRGDAEHELPRPFFQVEWPAQNVGISVTIGWGGQWTATAQRGYHGAVSLSAAFGFPDSDARADVYPAFRLVHGESLRVLRVLVLSYSLAHTRKVMDSSFNNWSEQTPAFHFGLHYTTFREATVSQNCPNGVGGFR
jgi:hypothetical protein